MAALIPKAPNLPPKPQTDSQLHPAAQQAAIQWSNMCSENDDLRAQVQRLNNEIEVSRQVDLEKDRLLNEARQRLSAIEQQAHERISQIQRIMQDKIDTAERAKERYLRFAVEISTRIMTAADEIAKAHDAAMMVAKDTEALEVEKNLQQLIDSRPKPDERGG